MYSDPPHPSLRGRRIQVVGHPGAGKSVFSTKLADVLQVPVLHLDSVFWTKDWTSVPVHKAQEVAREFADMNEWVIDGNQWLPLKDITYPRATDIIWLDPPFFVWLYRLLSRAFWKSLTQSGSFYKDFLNPSTSIVVLAVRRRVKKARNWAKMVERDERWRRVTQDEIFLEAVRRVQNSE